ncbi:MAG TPA: hypothetical protein VHI51_18950 [Ktedonobacterales bacterium]|jgi:F0F1-type ATP synthase membrane subunit c/vacuolar-type H+-ATPase subunit K|nr:hypothetical protein [Ktedonobacterales bacterium]
MENTGGQEPRGFWDRMRGQQSAFGVQLALGIAIGIAIGVAMGNIAVGIAIGVSIGVALGVAARGRRQSRP